MRNLGNPKVDAVTSADPTVIQAIKKDPSILPGAIATAFRSPIFKQGLAFPTDAKSLSRPHPYTSSGYDRNIVTQSAKDLDYLNADLAKYYGMDQTTAYNEALSNTAYQRAVKDMQAAGLNPAVLFGHGYVSGADGVYGAMPISVPSGAGSGSGYSRRSSGKLFSSDAYAAIAGAGALIGAVIGAKSGHMGIGAMTGSTIATSAADVLNGLYQNKFK